MIKTRNRLFIPSPGCTCSVYSEPKLKNFNFTLKTDKVTAEITPQYTRLDNVNNTVVRITKGEKTNHEAVSFKSGKKETDHILYNTSENGAVTALIKSSGEIETKSVKRYR